MINQITKNAEYCECPNCKQIAKPATVKQTEAGAISLPLLIFGGFGAIIITLISAEETPALGVLLAGLWFLYFLTIRKKTINCKVCGKCGYNYIIPLTEKEYLEKIKTTEAQ